MRRRVQATLFDLGPPPVTEDMRRDLKRLDDARPLGLTRVGNDYHGLPGWVRQFDAAVLTARDLAKVDYAGRYPRLKITAAGRAVLANLEGSR